MPALLTKKHVRLGVAVSTKAEAIAAVGHLLIDLGHVKHGYVESMLAREQQADTFLGHGVAIPHGRPQERDRIVSTGVVVVQIPAGVEWTPNQRVFIVVGIAARSDEHLTVLSALTDLLDNPEIVQQLSTTRDTTDFIAMLGRAESRAPTHARCAEPLPDAITVELRLGGKTGLHARPATRLAEVARRFRADIFVRAGGRTANAKSMPSLLKLGAESGTLLRLEASGADASAALEAFRVALSAEETLEVDPQPAAIDDKQNQWCPPATLVAIEGVPASPGFVVGPIYRMIGTHIVVQDQPSNPGIERKKLESALTGARVELESLRSSLAIRSSAPEAAIFAAHQALIDDEEFRAELVSKIELGHGASWAVQETVEQRAEEIRTLENARLAARAADWLDVGQRVLRLLTDGTTLEFSLPAHPVILVADDLTPSEAARLDPARVLGVCTAAGGPAAHSVIIARSIGIPAVVAAGLVVGAIPDGGLAILDGFRGRLYVNPDDQAMASALAFQQALRSRQGAEMENRFRPAIMIDGARIEVVANIGKPGEGVSALANGAEGVGLLRTEFLFLERDAAPSESEQFAIYSELARSLGGLPLIIRTLDIGGDKVVPYLPLAPEGNPFLGIRGIRLSLAQPTLFRAQLRAIYRAAAEGDVRIMFPMVGNLSEFRAAKGVAEEVRRELGAPEIEIGIMIEVPSAALLAAEFAREVSFFSIGTNDLTQYTLAIDRQHATLGKDADALHPAVLRLIAQTARAARGAGKWAGVCGGLASDPRGAVILAGLDIAELSVAIPEVPRVKAALRAVSSEVARELAQRALLCATAEEVRALPFSV